MERITFYFTYVWAIGLLLSICSCANQHHHPTFKLTNDSSIPRSSEPIVVKRKTIIQKTGAIPAGKSPLLVDARGDTIPSQLDDLDNDGTWDEMAFLAAIPANTTLTMTLKFINTDDYPKFTPRTNIRFGVKDSTGLKNRKQLTLRRDELPVAMYTMFQMDGPAWENDKVGFRHYMDGRNERDLYGKTSPKMALDTVGISPKGNLVDNYHVMEYWGRDILSVGNSLGIGGLAMLNNGKAIRLGVRADAQRNNVDTTTYRLITQGPVRSIFTLTYKGWHVGNKTYNVDDRISIWGGQYGYKSTVTVQNLVEADTLIVGLVNSNNDKPLMILDNTAPDWIGLATHDKQTYNKRWYLGLSLLLPKQNYISYQTAPKTGPNVTTSYNARMKLQKGASNTFTYYILAGWEISDKNFADRAYFKDFTQRAIEELQHPARIQ